MRTFQLLASFFLFGLFALSCGDSSPATISFGEPGSFSASTGKGSFTFGVATAATQIEDQNPNVDWYAWSLPESEGGKGESTFVGDAVRGYSKALDDVDLIEETHLDSYRFSVEWGRVEPERDIINEEALVHYGVLIDELVKRKIRPMITLHHFSNPLWVDDPRIDCPDGVTEKYLCGWHHPDGADVIIEEIAEHARLLGSRYGDRVDDWATLNEPVNYLVASYGVGFFPPGRSLLLTDFDAFMTVVRNYIRAHVAIYDALKESDTVDADGDGIAANVGFTLNVVEWTPARDNEVSDNPEDIAARDRVLYVYHHLFVESLRQGAFDANIDTEFEEAQPDWKDKLDWLGVQYYSRISVTGERKVLPGVDALICLAGYDFGSCLNPEDPTKWVPSMHYNVLSDFGKRWPDLPFILSESGIATNVGKRRSEHIVRSLEQMHRAMEEGVDIRGYYHWSLTDNFEWAEGYLPRFGLYRVNYETYERTATEGAILLGEIAKDRKLTTKMRETYGGLGPMTPEE